LRSPKVHDIGENSDKNTICAEFLFLSNEAI
jgi:hypothetical protein